MSKFSNKPRTSSRDVLIDSNIIQYYYTTLEFTEQIKEVVVSIVKAGYGIAMSDITFYELINGSSVEREKKMFEAINGLKRYYTTKKVLVGAGQLGCLYEGNKLNDIDLGDKIIASTATLNNAIIFTANGRHFPQPFFKELDRKILQRTDKNGLPVNIMTYFMEPDLEIIGYKHKNRIEGRKIED